MEEDILYYSPTVMFRGTPCSWKLINQTTTLLMIKVAERSLLWIVALGINSTVSSIYLSKGLKSRSSENIPKKNPENVFDEPDIKLETVDLEPEILEEQEKPPKERSLLKVFL